MNRRQLLGAAGAISALGTVALPVAMARTGQQGFVARLQLGPAQDAAFRRRRASIVAGEVSGTLLCGVVAGGHVEWLVDPASGAVDLAVVCRVRCEDGAIVELRDRTVQDFDDGIADTRGLPSAPELVWPSRVTDRSMAGRLDVTDFTKGHIRMRALPRHT